MVQGIKDLAAENGFTGEYYADEILWITVDEPDWDTRTPYQSAACCQILLKDIDQSTGHWV